MINTSDFIEKLVLYLNTVRNSFSVYYDRAPSNRTFPYGVVSKITATDLGEGDLTMFDIDLWTDDKKPSATEELESLCDDLRNALHNRVISHDGVFSAHIGYEGRDTSDDRDDDISHRRLFFAARIFYI